MRKHPAEAQHQTFQLTDILTSMDGKRPSSVVPAVDRAIELLRAIARAGKPLTLAELSEMTATSRSTAFNTLATLQAHGLIEKDERFKTYSLGLALFELGNAYLAQVSLVPAFMETARRLVEACSETVKLVIRDGRDVVYLAAQEGPQSVRLVAITGTRMPAHATAVGKVLLAELDDAELEQLFCDYDFPVRTANTINDLSRLKSELAMVRQQGFAYDHEESSIGVNCVAAPVRDRTGSAIAAMSIGIPNHRLVPHRMEELTELILQAAAELSRTLGWIEPRPPEGHRAALKS